MKAPTTIFKLNFVVEVVIAKKMVSLFGSFVKACSIAMISICSIVKLVVRHVSYSRGFERSTLIATD